MGTETPHEFGGLRVHQAVKVPGSDNRILCLDWSDRPEGVEEWHPYDNVLRVTPGGAIVWRATAPSGGWKCFVGVSVADGVLRAFTSDGFVELGWEDGRAGEFTFTK
ncbi:MAG: hypothetical protein U5R31_17150 [Acidimicrobiia bacterium]|nr:hypothetical protein [Acidimicrobiia bacterium]